MALHITNADVEQKVRNLASLTGESITEAIGAAAEERIQRVQQGASPGRDPSVQEILDLVRSFDLKPIKDGLTEDEILGYGPSGYCE